MTAPFADLAFDLSTGRLEGRGHALHLPRRQAQVFAALWRAAEIDPGLYLSGLALAERCGNSVSGVKVAAFYLRGKLAPFALDLQSRMGPGGGFRLVDAPRPQGHPATSAEIVEAVQWPSM